MQCGMHRLRAVPKYKHLGIWAARTGTVRPELCRRATEADKAIAALSRHLFAATRVVLRERLRVCSAVADSLLVDAAGW